MPAITKPCGCCCAVAKQSFDLEPEPLDGLELGGKWTFAPEDVWSIIDMVVFPNELACDPTPTSSGPYRAYWQQEIPRAFAVTSSVGARTPGSTPRFRMVYQADDGGEGTRRYAAEIEFTAADSNDDTDECGTLRLLDLTNLLSPATLAEVPVATLAHRVRYHLTLCYNPNSQILSASVTSTQIESQPNRVLGIQSIHAKDCATPEDLESSTLWLEWLDLPTSGGLGQVASVSASDTKNPIEPTDEEFIGEAKPKCPCCRPSRCTVTYDDFENGEIDCRWVQLVGTWVEADGKIHTTGGAGTIAWRGSHAGANDDCLPDCSVKVWVEFILTAEPYGVSRGYIELVGDDGDKKIIANTVLTVNGDGTAAAGALAISFKNGVDDAITLDTVTFENMQPGAKIRLAVCYLHGDITAIVSDVTNSYSVNYNGGMSPDSYGYGYDYDDNPDNVVGEFCFGYAKIVDQLGGSDNGYTHFQISHNLDSIKCDDCYSNQRGDGGDDDDDGPTGPGPYQPPGGPGTADTCDDPDYPDHLCKDATYPWRLKARIAVFDYALPEGQPEGNCPAIKADIIGTYILKANQISDTQISLIDAAINCCDMEDAGGCGTTWVLSKPVGPFGAGPMPAYLLTVAARLFKNADNEYRLCVGCYVQGYDNGDTYKGVYFNGGTHTTPVTIGVAPDCTVQLNGVVDIGPGCITSSDADNNSDPFPFPLCGVNRIVIVVSNV
jgi:hypothetical protein